jgi:PAS domain S-box-containing protein
MVDAKFRKATTTHSDWNFECRIRRVDGVVRWIWAAGRHRVDATGSVRRMAGIVQDITERKRAEETLRENEEKLRLLGDNLPDSAVYQYVHEPDGSVRFLYFSAGIERLNGVSIPDVLRDPGTLHRQIPPEYFEQLVEAEARSARELSDFDMDLPMQLPDGQVRWMRLHSRPRRLPDGQIIWNGVQTDITERKRTEEELKQSEKQYRTLGDTIPYGVWLTDATGYCTYASPSFLEMVDMSMENVQKFGWLHLLPPDDVQPTVDHWLRCIQTGENFEREHRFRTKDGNYRNVLAIGRPIKNEEGKITEWVGFNLDITERKQIEDSLKNARDSLEANVKERTSELEKAYKSLKESEQRLADAQKIAHVGSWDWNIATNEEYWSDELYRIFELDPHFELNHNTFLNFIHREDLEYVSHAINEALNGKPYNIDYRIILPDGEERVIYSQGGVIFDEKNTPILMRGIVQDITERKKAEDVLAKIEIVRKQEIHHRIKNNLQVISSLLDLQSEMFRDKEEIKDSEVLEAFRNSQNRVISMALIHEELYKGGGFETLNFSSYIEELAKSLLQSYSIGNIDISLKIDLVENAFFDMDNAIPLGIIVNELVSNSFKHAFPGRDKGEIQIKLQREEGEDCSSTFVLSVSDNGVGIPENLDIENLESLGLQLVTSLVDQLDGELELKRNNGTEFTIRFTVTEKDNQVSAPAVQQSI